ncbi:alkaline phosphatase [Asticcacaulis sp. AC460]|uniref:alkaline phosphatase n=1 Tax=Asticcacaulis sp. AC460 TaxID=1282360 RepID=UPI0003C40AD8|nr:alkaline phosphatase [Asticcacaulis sp. AC460]ESQ86956.1 alkaline phosphatase [Asticcacaulis sp. AC460]
MKAAILALLLMLPAAAQAADSATNPQFTAARAALNNALNRQPPPRRARNVILFIGDGMGINSVTAGRILAGQTRGRDGASYQLSFETLPYSGLSKTYSADKLVTDSSNGISAIMTGVKTINAATGVDDSVTGKDCPSALKGRIPTLAEQAARAGLATGVVTTSGITDATPAGAYGHTTFRGWRADADLPPEAPAAGCIDLARQLVEAPEAIRLDVAFGGDLNNFLPSGTGEGRRKDGLDLTATWLGYDHARLVRDAAGLAALDTRTPGPVLGLFAGGDLPSAADRPDTVPGLAAMTATAIDLLSQDPDGYVLLVESAAIDKWHHQNNAYRALTEVDELSKAVQVAMERTDPRDTLIIVTADHSHGLVLTAGSGRDEPVLGLVRYHGELQTDGNGRPRTTLSYATGPSGPKEGTASAIPDQATVLAKDYRQPALTYMTSAQHAGEDVPVYARGPDSDLLTGTFESNYIYQVMAHALDLDARLQDPAVRLDSGDQEHTDGRQ